MKDVTGGKKGRYYEGVAYFIKAAWQAKASFSFHTNAESKTPNPVALYFLESSTKILPLTVG